MEWRLFAVNDSQTYERFIRAVTVTGSLRHTMPFPALNCWLLAQPKLRNRLAYN
jgi:hypothetical protein